MTEQTIGHVGGSAVDAAELWMRELGLPRYFPGPSLEPPYTRILVATDLGAASRQVEDRAMELAEATGASLSVLALRPLGEALDVAAETRLREIALRRTSSTVTDRACEQTGDPASSILEAAREGEADLIVIGLDQWQRWPRSMACGHVVSRSTCPVLVVRIR